MSSQDGEPIRAPMNVAEAPSKAAEATAADWQIVADRQAVAELIYRYCRAVDRLDIALGHSIWHEDGFGRAVRVVGAWTSGFRCGISTKYAM